MILYDILWALGMAGGFCLSIKVAQQFDDGGLLLAGILLTIAVGFLVLYYSFDHTPPYLKESKPVTVISKIETPKGFVFFYQEGGEFHSAKFYDFESVNKIKNGAVPYRVSYVRDTAVGPNTQETAIELR